MILKSQLCTYRYYNFKTLYETTTELFRVDLQEKIITNNSETKCVVSVYLMNKTEKIQHIKVSNVYPLKGNTTENVYTPASI